MKRIFTAALLALSSVSFGATLVPVQLLNPAGSTSGQVPVSTGPTSPPGWGTVALSGVTGTLAITNGGTGATTVTGALTSLGAAPLAGTNTWSAAQTFSALITPSSTIGIKGTGTNDNAQTGSVGEYPTPVSTIGTSIGNNANANATSITLSPGDWDISCVATFHPSIGAIATGYIVGTSSASLTLGSFGTYVQSQLNYTIGANQTIGSPHWRYSFASSTTVYCFAQGSFSGSGATMTVDGIIEARRPR